MSSILQSSSLVGLYIVVYVYSMGRGAVYVTASLVGACLVLFCKDTHFRSVNSDSGC